jgi:hypothetical protein
MRFNFRKCVIFFLAIILFPPIVFAEDTILTDESVPFLYESRAEIKAPDTALAEYISTDYRSARDEFTKHDLFQQIKPILDKKLKEAKESKNVVLRIGARLGDYDFDKKAFSTGFGEATFIPFDNGYAVTFINGEQIEMLQVPMASAKSLSSSLQKSREAKFDVYGEIVGAKEESINYFTKKAIKVKITKLRVTLQSGMKVGEKTL